MGFFNILLVHFWAPRTGRTPVHPAGKVFHDPNRIPAAVSRTEPFSYGLLEAYLRPAARRGREHGNRRGRVEVLHKAGPADHQVLFVEEADHNNRGHTD